MSESATTDFYRILAAALERQTFDRSNLNDEILFTGQFQISEQEYRRSLTIISRRHQKNTLTGFISELDRASIIGFWPLLIGAIICACTEDVLVGTTGGFASLFAYILLRRLRWNWLYRKTVNDSSEFMSQLSPFYLTRRGLVFLSKKYLFARTWKDYSSIESIDQFFFLMVDGKNTWTIPKSVFESDKEQELFFKLTTALIAGKPYDHLLTQEVNWPPKPKI